MRSEDQPEIQSSLASGEGPSPRGRGRRLTRRPSVTGSGSIPAWAGRHPERDYRVSRCGPSPRGRGRRSFAPCPTIFIRSIPARAGETTPVGTATSPATVHPRAGGGDWKRLPNRLAEGGPSPRGRGRRSGIATNPERGRYTCHRLRPHARIQLFPGEHDLVRCFRLSHRCDCFARDV